MMEPGKRILLVFVLGGIVSFVLSGAFSELSSGTRFWLGALVLAVVIWIFRTKKPVAKTPVPQALSLEQSERSFAARPLPDWGGAGSSPAKAGVSKTAPPAAPSNKPDGPQPQAGEDRAPAGP
jgi:hypothetical protein